MFAAIEGLLVLQERDQRLTELSDQLDRLPHDEARAKSRLSNDEAAVADARKTLQLNGVDAKNLELDVETRKTTISRLTKQQFETRKNEEFQALKHEIDRYRSEVDDLETKQLELMEKADKLRSLMEAAESSLAMSQKVVDEDLTALTERAKNLSSEKETVTADRKELGTGVEEELLELYERLLVQKKGVAVSPLHGGQCGGCHVKLIPATLVKVIAGSEVAQCENCGRILYST